MADRVTIFYGPRSEFNKVVEGKTAPDEVTVKFLDSIRLYNEKIRASTLATRSVEFNPERGVDNCVVGADDFGSVTSHVIPNFSGILEESYQHIGNLFVNNPPRRVLESIKASQAAGSIEEIAYDYGQVKKGDLRRICGALRKDVLGQEQSKTALIGELYKLAVMGNEKPSSVLLYGPSGVGKTETAQALSKALGGNLLRVQFSMMQTEEAYNYLFGAEHSKASFARDLLGRESNVVLIDEIDKVSPRLYNMFYQLFDEGRYVDTNYDVDMRGSLFLLTSNYSSEAEARRAMGPAMFSRINASVGFTDLGPGEKSEIVKRRYNKVLSCLDEEDQAVIESSEILRWFLGHVDRYNNMRTLKNKIDKAIFEKLSESIIENSFEG